MIFLKDNSIIINYNDYIVLNDDLYPYHKNGEILIRDLCDVLFFYNSLLNDDSNNNLNSTRNVLNELKNERKVINKHNEKDDLILAKEIEEIQNNLKELNNMIDSESISLNLKKKLRDMALELENQLFEKQMKLERRNKKIIVEFDIPNDID